VKQVKKITDWAAMRLLAHPAREAIIEACGREPRSIQDLAKALGLNPGSVHNHVHKLKDAGYLEVVATRVVNGIVEQKYRCIAHHFDFSEVDPKDRPKRNRFIAKELGRDALSLLEADEKTTALRLVADLSPEELERARGLVRQLRNLFQESNGSGDIPCRLVIALGRRKNNEKS
jgi:DNA-binding MarR family transcriptional regulator